MANLPLAVSIVALLVAATSIGYANLTISGELGQLRTQLNAAEQTVSALQNNVADLKGSLQRSLEETRKQVAEREALIQQITPFDTGLVAAAIKEGSVTLYSVRDQQDLVLIAQEFQKKFPGIRVNFFSARSSELLARISAEMKLPQSTWDIYDNAGPQPPAAVELGATQPYRSKEYTKDNFPIIDARGHVHWYGATVPIVVYNSKLVKKSDVESVKTWEDVPTLAAKYPGKVLLDHPARLGTLTTVLGELKTLWNNDAKWNKYLNDLKALNARMFKSSGEIARLVISEEGAIGIVTLLHDVLQAQERQAPVDFLRLRPIVVQPTGYVLSKNAPHPNAGKLLIEYMLSPDGQEIFSRAYRSPLRIGFVAKSSFGVLFPNVPPNEIFGNSNPEVLGAPQAFTTKYLEPIFGPP